MASSNRLSRLSQPLLTSSALPHQPLVVGLSGGADSGVCAWLGKQSGEPVRAIYIHHGTYASDRLGRAAHEIADLLGIELVVLQADIPTGASPELQARLIRYRLLEEELEDEEQLITGHTRTDQVETMLLRLWRGTGPSGLVGMHSPQGRICRPLLGQSRSEVRELAVLLDLPFYDDPTNLDLRYTRNRVRNRLLPSLERDFGFGVEVNLSRYAQLLAEDQAELSDRWGEQPIEQHSFRLWARIPRGVLISLPPNAQGRVLRDLIGKAGIFYPPPSEQIREFLSGLEQDREWNLAGGVTILVGGPWVEVRNQNPDHRCGGEISDQHSSCLATEPTGIEPNDSLVWGEWQVHAYDLEKDGEPSRSPWEMKVAVHDFPLQLRPKRRQDRIAITEGSKTVDHALSESGLAFWEQENWPVVEAADGRVIWVPGVRQEPKTLTSEPADYHMVQILRNSPWR